jgi:hypothetical protein
MSKAELEKRLVALEAKMEAWETRRAKLIPPELDADPNVAELCADHVKSAVAGWKLCLRETGRNLAEARFVEATRQAERELDQKALEAKQHEEAEVCAAIKFYERTGQSPPGYEIVVEPDFETTFPRPQLGD